MDLVSALGGFSGGGGDGAGMGALAQLKHKLGGGLQGFGQGIASLNPTISKAYNAGQGGEFENASQNFMRDRVGARNADMDAAVITSSQPSESPQSGQQFGALDRLKRYGMNPTKGGR